MNFSEKKIRGETVFSGKILKLEVDVVALPDGGTAKRECVRHHGGAAVFCAVEGKLLLVRQFRYLYGKEMYEIPAGKLEEGENPLIAAARELEEETGTIAEELVPLLKLYPTPGYTDEVIHIYEAKNCRFKESNPDEGEFLSVTFLPLSEVEALIRSGEIADAKTVSAFYKYMYENK